MNQRISRAIVLCIVAMLVLGLGVQWGGTTSIAAAQEAGCGPWLPYAEAEATPRAEPEEQDAYQILSEFESVDELTPDLMVDVLLTQVMLFDDGTLSVLSGQSSIIRVDTGLVQITICEGSQVEIQQAGTDRPTRFGAGTFDIPAGGAIIVEAGDQYYLTSSSAGTDTSEASGTPTAATPVSDEARTGSTITIVTWDGIRLLQGLCGGAGC
jgi:hypothetical protein